LVQREKGLLKTYSDLCEISVFCGEQVFGYFTGGDTGIAEEKFKRKMRFVLGVSAVKYFFSAI